MKKLATIIILGAFLVSCASLTNDAYVPVAISFSDGSEGTCKLSNKRNTMEVEIPNTPLVRRSDDDLQYDCTAEHGGKAFGVIPSVVGAKIVASAVFLDFGITDAITDKHREYPSSFVIPMTQ